MMFPLAENGRTLGVNPEEHFFDALSRVDDHPVGRTDELAPHGWIMPKNA